MLSTVPTIDAALAADAKARGAAHIPLRIGIGVNTGEVFVGNMGSDQRFDYSIVGDPVNVAARLETATKEFGRSGHRRPDDPRHRRSVRLCRFGRRRFERQNR